MNPGHPRYMQACMVRWFYKGSNTILLLHQYYCTSNLYSSKFQKKKKLYSSSSGLLGMRVTKIRGGSSEVDWSPWPSDFSCRSSTGRRQSVAPPRKGERERERLTLNHLQQLAMAMLIQTQGPSILFIPPFRYPSLSPSFNSLYRIRSHIDN